MHLVTSKIYFKANCYMKSPDFMLIFGDLQAAFLPAWRPVYMGSKAGDFEQQLKDYFPISEL